MVHESIAVAVQNYLRACNEKGLDIRFGVLYGSHVKDTAHEWSDIDLLVVSARFDRARSLEDKHTLWRLAANIDSRIEPIACGLHQWETDDSSAVIEIARREGQRIDPPVPAPTSESEKVSPSS